MFDYFAEYVNWSVEEKDEFIDTLLMFVYSEDKTYDLYQFFKEIEEESEHATFPYDTFRKKFIEFYFNELNEEDNGVEFYEKFYQ